MKYMLNHSNVCMIHLFLSEYILKLHHYTNSTVKTAEVAVNAGTCLEDGNYEDNIFSVIGDAMSQV